MFVWVIFWWFFDEIVPCFHSSCLSPHLPQMTIGAYGRPTNSPHTHWQCERRISHQKQRATREKTSCKGSWNQLLISVFNFFHFSYRKLRKSFLHYFGCTTGNICWFVKCDTILERYCTQLEAYEEIILKILKFNPIIHRVGGPT